MQHQIKSVRPFIGANKYDVSRNFYRDLGFKESVLSSQMSYFQIADFGFYLQNAYVRDWIDNSMIFVEVDDVNRYWTELYALELPAKYEGSRLTPIREWDWGRECYLHDPSGILWHFGEFNK